MDDIKVTVVEFSDRKHYQLQYRDPLTSRKKTKSSGIDRSGGRKARTDAEREAAKWEESLRSGRYREPSKITWSDFRERYEQDVLASLAETTDRKVQGVFNVFEEIVNPQKLRAVTAERLSAYQTKLRERKLSESTIKGHLAHLQAALNWAKRMGMLVEVPTIDMPKRAKGSKLMKGRPITLEEFERMIGKIRKAVFETPTKRKKGKVAESKPAEPKLAREVDPDREAHIVAVVATWKHYLEGLWASGLRLEESLELCWDRDDKLCVDITGKRPMLRIPAELEKGNEDRLLPIAPEFAEFLLQTPKDDRTGYVFRPLGCRPSCGRPTVEYVGRVVSRIGEAAGVKVSTDTKGKVKFASAHDLRRSFGERWASRLMPQVLMELMRHESIETTMRYYVGRNAQATADVLWQAHEQQSAASNTPSNTSSISQ